jgi:flagellin
MSRQRTTNADLFFIVQEYTFMTAALSAQMTANLVSLMSINDSIATTQDRLNTGKKVNSVLDGAAVFFKAQGLSEKAANYDPVNANIKQALNNITVASKAVDTMYDNLNGLLTQLRDAAAKNVGVLARTNVTGSATYGAGAAAGTATGIVGDGTMYSDPTKFQNNDTFAIQIVDGTRTVTRHFRASNVAGVGGGDGSTLGAATTFSTLNELQTAVQTAFGADDIRLTVTGGGALNLTTVGNAAMTVNIAQTGNAVTGGAPGVNALLDLSRIFGAPVNNTEGLMTSQGAGNLTIANGAATTAVLGTQVSYTSSGAAVTAANSETRIQAADTYRATLVQINNIARDAYLPGFEALLMGRTMSVDLNDDAGDVVQNVTVGAVNTAALSFIGFVAATGNDSSSATNFQDDTTITTAINRVNNAMRTLRLRQNQLATFTTMMSTRMQYNQEFQKILNDASTSITSANTAEEAAKLASLQNQQAFATNNLSVTKNGEQSLIQLLR